MGLTQDEVGVFRFFNLYDLDFHVTVSCHCSS
jgi:hypothetical protein